MNNCWNSASTLPEKSENDSVSDILKVKLFNGKIVHGFYSFIENGYVINHLLFTDENIVQGWTYA